MADMLPKKFKLLSDEEFWKLSRQSRLQYLKSAAECSKRAVKPAKPGSRKHS